MSERVGQIGGCGATALPVEDRRVIEADAVLRGAVEVVVVRDAGFLRGLHESEAQRMPEARVADLQGPVGAMKRLGQPQVRFGALEYRQHVVPAPARAAECGPVVIVVARTAHVQHRVDRTAATERAALRHVGLASRRARLRLALERDRALRAEHTDERRRNPDEQAVVLRAVLEQQYTPAGLHQPMRDRTAGRTAADDDVVVRLHPASSPCCRAADRVPPRRKPA